MSICINTIRFDKNATYLLISSNKGFQARSMKNLENVSFEISPSESGVNDSVLSLDSKQLILGTAEGKVFFYRRD